LRDPELAEETEIPAADAGAAQQVPACGAEAEIGLAQSDPGIRKSERIEIGIPQSDAAKLLHLALDEVGALVAFGRVERGAVSRHAEGLAAQETEDVVDLPAADYPREHSTVTEPLTPLAERQLDNVRDLHVVRAVKVAERSVEVEELRD